MRRDWIYCLFIMFLITVSQSLAYEKKASWVTPEVKRMIDCLMDNEIIFGMAIGVVTKEGEEIYCIGKTAGEGGKEIDKDTVFRLGSTTKGFTGILFADLVLKKKVILNDPLDKFLPKSVKVPERKNRKIKFIDLVTHSSALPVRSTDFNILANEDYTLDQLYLNLSTIELEWDIGKKYSYSSLGASLVGHVVCLIEKKTYSEVLKEKICDELGMKSTDVILTEDMQQRISKGHDQRKPAVWLYIPDVFSPSGSISTTIGDMLKFLEANLGLTDSPIKDAMKLSHGKLRDYDDRSLGMFWRHFDKEGKTYIGHSGDTFGFSAYVGFDKEKTVGVAVLSNGKMGVKEIAFHIMSGGKYKLKIENILRYYYE